MHIQENILKRLNAIGPAWVAQFERAPELSLSFVSDSLGTLFVNGIPLCRVSEVDIDSIFIDVEYFGFSSTAGHVYRIFINWPYDGSPKVSYVSIGDADLLESLAN